MKNYPADPCAEQALLGSMLLEPKVLPDVLAHVDDPSAFSDERNAAIFRAIIDAYAADPSADPVHVRALLAERGELERVGGEAFLIQLGTEVPSGWGGGGYARIVAARARERAAMKAMDDAIKAQEAGLDLGETIGKLSSELRRIESHGTESEEVQVSFAARRVREDIAARTDAYLPTGLAAFDSQFGGIPRVGVTTILGVPGSGKSSLATNIVTGSALEAGAKWRIFSFEVGANQIAQNIMASLSQVPINDIRRRRADPAIHEWDQIDAAIRDLDRLDLAVIEKNLNAEGIALRCARYASSGVRCFVIDYAQNVAPSFPDQPEREKIASVMRSAQEIARCMEGCVLVVSQPTLDAGRDDRPLRASDVKGAQELWGGSDLLISVYRSAAVRSRQRDETDDEWDTRRRGAELHVVKNKTGPTGMLSLDFRPEVLRFS